MNTFKAVAKFAKISMGLSVVVLLVACSTTKPAETPPPVQRPAAPTPPPAPPAGPRAGSIAEFQQVVGDRVRFEYDRSDVDTAGRDTLNKQAAWLAKYPTVTIQVEGHCDERGTREYNIALGARRAASVKEYLVSQGVASSRVDTISYGKERPVCAESNEGCWAQNRRGVSVITAGAAS